MLHKLMILLIVFMLFVVGCGENTEKGQMDFDLPKILVSPKGLVHSFWVTVKAGADSAGREFGANIIWKGPAQETDIARQISIVEDYMNKHVDAIVLAACDTKALLPVVKKAQARNIPVITIDSGLEEALALSHVATNNIAAAEKAAATLAELIGGEGTVACIPFVPGAATSIMRESGFINGIRAFPKIEVSAVQYSQSDVATAMAVTEDILTAQPDLKGIFAANEAGVIGAVQGLKSKNKTGQVKLVGFDAAPNEVKALENGALDALIVQDPFKMGYLGVKMAMNALQGKPVEKKIDTGVYVITRENLNEPAIQKLITK